MVLIDLNKVIGSLGLVSSIAKPLPVVGPVIGSVADTVGGMANSTAPSLSGPLAGLLSAGVATTSSGNGSDLAAASSSSGSNDNTTTVQAADADADAYNDPCAMSPYSPSEPVYLESFPAYDANQALIYRYRQQQSVNLGSWFVQEQWMVPSLFTCAAGNKQAELDIANGWGSVDNARQVLERHWDTWITEDDFVFMSSIGINTVRLPIGYWSLGPTYCQGTPFERVSAAYVNSWARVVRAINWAEKHGMGVLVDLHGAPGSQNGQGHSGVSDGVQNLFDNPGNVQLTLNVLTYLVQQLVKVNNVVGIQILNEPNNVPGLPAFYSQAITKLRQVAPEAASFPFYIHDGFDLKRFADYISTRSDFVVVDHHQYFVFGDPASQKTPASELAASLQPVQGGVSGELLAAAAEGRRNLVVDEWSCALSQEALQGSPDAIADRQRFCTGQMESYTNATAGWAFWSYKTENCDSDVNWCFKSAVGKSLPQTFFSYPKAAIQQLAGLMGADSAAATSNTQWLTIGSPVVSSNDGAYRPPTNDDWLAAMGASAPQYVGVTEALAHTEYDLSINPSIGITEVKGDSLPGQGPNFGDADADAEYAEEDDYGILSESDYTSSSSSAIPSPTSSQIPSSTSFSSTSSATAPSATSSEPSLPPLAAAAAPQDQAAFGAESYSEDDTDGLSNEMMLNTATIPSSRMQLGETRKRSLDRFAHRAFLLASDVRKHRFAARHLRAASERQAKAKRQAPPASPDGMSSPQQNAITRGYSDGWRAAKTFAAAGGSRLGFSGQFISDALTALGSEVMSGDAMYYRTWFLKGLADGEVQVLKSKVLDAQGPDAAA